MGYFLTTEPENAVPGKSLASPKTHTPGSRLQERGLRYYSANMARWLSRDPIGEPGFELTSRRQKTQSEIEREAEAELYALLSQVDPALAARLGLRPGLPQHHLYPFVNNDPLNQFDPYGLSCFTECWKKCIKDNYGKSFDVALGLSYLSVVQISQRAD